MIYEAIISSLIVFFALLVSLFLKSYIKEELKVIKPYCKLINIFILIGLTVVTLQNLKSFYLIIGVLIGYITQKFIKTRLFAVPLGVYSSALISLNYLFSFSSLLSFYYLLFGYSEDLKKKDLIIAFVFHVILFFIVYLSNFKGIILAILSGLFIGIITEDIRVIWKEKWYSI